MERIEEKDRRDNQKKTTSDLRMERIEEGSSGFIRSILKSGVVSEGTSFFHSRL